jgi:hypothetical protein
VSALVCPVCEMQFDVVNGLIHLDGLEQNE